MILLGDIWNIHAILVGVEYMMYVVVITHCEDGSHYRILDRGVVGVEYIMYVVCSYHHCEDGSCYRILD